MVKITIVLACMFIGMMMLVEPASAGPSAIIDEDFEAEKASIALKQLMEQDFGTERIKRQARNRECVS